ncbi:MAG: PLP-dependent aminotransferase family protein [Eubacteriales bacterium]|nr:PLP-dependent aminotransferase family protein [Eubacteriales bacterium]
MNIREKRQIKLLTWTLDPGSQVPMYEQLCQLLRREIQTHVLPPGKRLPSKRVLAAHLGVSTITVENAYSQLVAEGQVETLLRRGYFVRKSYEPFDKSFLKKQAKLEKSGPLIDRYKTAWQREREAQKPPVLACDFSTNRVDTASFPFTIWARLSRQVLQEEGRDLLEVSPPQGDERLRASIARHLQTYRGMSCDPEQIIIGAGSEYLFSLIIQLLGPGRHYAIEDPGYVKISRILEKHKAQVLRFEVDRHGMFIHPLELAKPDVIYLTPSHQFPTGVVMPLKRRENLLHRINGFYDHYIIEDDYDSEFRFSGRPIPALHSLDQQGQVIYLGTFSKSLAPSLRISYLVLPPQLLLRYRQELMFYASTVSRLEQMTLARFIDGGYFEHHLNKMRRIYRERRDALIAAIEAWQFRSKIEINGIETGLHLVVVFPAEIGEEALVTAAAKVGIRVHGLFEYTWDNPNPETPPRAASRRLVRPPTLILGYAHLTPEELVAAAERLHQAWAGLVH